MASGRLAGRLYGKTTEQPASSARSGETWSGPECRAGRDSGPEETYGKSAPVPLDRARLRPRMLPRARFGPRMWQDSGPESPTGRLREDNRKTTGRLTGRLALAVALGEIRGPNVAPGKARAPNVVSGKARGPNAAREDYGKTTGLRENFGKTTERLGVDYRARPLPGRHSGPKSRPMLRSGPDIGGPRRRETRGPKRHLGLEVRLRAFRNTWHPCSTKQVHTFLA